MTCWAARCVSLTTCRIRRSPASPTSRQLSAFDYSLDGTTITATDQHGRTIHTTLGRVGPPGRPGRRRPASPTPATYDDAAHTTTKTVVPDGAGQCPKRCAPPRMTTPTGPSPSNTTTATGPPTPSRPRPSTGSAGGVATVRRSRVGVLLPRCRWCLDDPDRHPPQPGLPRRTVGFEPLDRSRRATDQQPTPTPDGATADGTGLTYDPAGRIATSTDPNGRVTSYTYYADGNVATRTTPSGTVVTDTYDDTTGRLSNVTAEPPSVARR